MYPQNGSDKLQLKLKLKLKLKLIQGCQTKIQVNKPQPNPIQNRGQWTSLSQSLLTHPPRKVMGDPSLGGSLDINDKRSGIECQRIGQSNPSEGTY